VEVEAEGARKDLERLLRRLREGPPLAEIERVDAAWDAYRGDFQGWDLRW
jgi:acylphosphatase